jgi:MFS family permease
LTRTPKASPRPSTAAGKIIALLGLNRSLAGLLGVVVLVGLGEKMAERFLPIYLLALGGGLLSVGLLNGLDNLLSALYSFPGGYLADRFGTKRALLVFNGMAMAGYLVVILVPRWYAVILGAVLFLSWTAISLPAAMQLVSTAIPRNRRTMGVSMHSLIKRVPMSLGPLMGGAFIGVWGERDGVRLAFVAALVMAAVATVLQERLITETPPLPGERRRGAEKNPLRLWTEMSPDLRRLLVSDILVRFCEQIPYAFVVIWAMKDLGTPGVGGRPVTAFQFGILTTIEMAVAVLCYIPVAYYADRIGKKPFVVLTFGFFTLFPVVLWFSRSFWPLAGAFVVRGLKEFGEPTRKALIMDLAPEDRKAGMFGLYYLVRDVVVSLAAFGGALLWRHSPQVNLATAFAFGVLGTAWFAWKGKAPAAPVGRG